MRRSFVLLIFAACSTAGAPPAQDAAGGPGPITELVQRLAEPPYGKEVRSLRLKRSIVVRAEPREDAKALGTVAADTRVGWRNAERGPGCSRWIEIQPRGWVCEKYLEPTNKEPMAVELPRLADGEIVPGVYGRVLGGGAPAYASVEDVKRGKVARQLAGAVTLRRMAEVTVGNRTFWKTSNGDLVDAKKIGVHKPSTFAGVKDPELPIAWTRKGRERVSEWANEADVHIARAAEPPPLTGPDERWIDIDLDQQVLVAYEGTQPVFATLVSSGNKKWPTPEGIYRVWIKFAETDMNGQMGDEQPYSVATVPWTVFFAKDLALHTAYWHDRFGQARSHGCINLSPADARTLYFWTAPDVPAGWSMAHGVFERPGSVVRVRSRAVPQPEFMGYARRVYEARVTESLAAPAPLTP